MILRDIELIRGDTYPFEITVKKSNGDAINLYGASFRMTAKFSKKDTDLNAAFTLTSPGDISVTQASSGKLTVYIPPSATSSLPPVETLLYYDIQMQDSSSAVYTICMGKIKVIPDVSITIN